MLDLQRWRGWCHMKLQPSWRKFCIHHTTMLHVTSCKATYYHRLVAVILLVSSRHYHCHHQYHKTTVEFLISGLGAFSFEENITTIVSLLSPSLSSSLYNSCHHRYHHQYYKNVFFFLNSSSVTQPVLGAFDFEERITIIVSSLSPSLSSSLYRPCHHHCHHRCIIPVTITVIKNNLFLVSDSACVWSIQL